MVTCILLSALILHGTACLGAPAEKDAEIKTIQFGVGRGVSIEVGEADELKEISI